MEHAAPDLGDCGLRWSPLKNKDGHTESRAIASGEYMITHYTVNGFERFHVMHGKDLIAIKDSAQQAKDYARDYEAMEP